MFNLQGSELIIILLLALVVLGPEKLPEAMRKLGQFYAELKKMSHGFQQEFRNATDEPMREIRETATALRDSVDFRKFASGERDEKPKSADMASATPMKTTLAPPDPSAVPTTDVPNGETDFAPPNAGSRAPDSDAIGPPRPAAEPVDIAPETLPAVGEIGDT